MLWLPDVIPPGSEESTLAVSSASVMLRQDVIHQAKRSWVQSGEVREFLCNAALATLTLVCAEALCMQQGQALHVFSMAHWKQCQFNERLLEVFLEKCALDPTLVKNHACDDERRTYGAIAA